MEKPVYIRFVVGTEDEDYRWLTGIITQARVLRDDGRLEAYEVDWLQETYNWLNKHLPCPPFSQGKWSKDAVSWFRDNAGEPLKRMWDIVALLKEHGVPVRVVRTTNPGKVVYEDTYQIVAETRWKKWKA